MIGFHFFGLSFAVFLCLKLANHCFKEQNHRRMTVKIVLLTASYLFMAYADWRFALILALISIITYYSARKNQYGMGIIASLATLAFFKYTNFFCSSFAQIVGRDYTFLNIILPLGISFYTFSAISYIVDVKHGKQKARPLLDVMVYLSFFPKLTSGPIQKSGDFFQQLDTEREIGLKSFETGIQIFVFGMFKKIVLADRLSIFVDQVYTTPKAFGSVTVLLAAIAYSLQIYFDFSGYSDMAIGTSKILGFDLPRNFNLPYLSHNVTELWKRWHISLSSWLQEYLYF